MASSALTELQKVVSKDPTLANVSVGELLARLSTTSPRGRLPSLGEFGDLLDEVISTTGVAFTDDDLSLLKIGHNIHVEFDHNDNDIPKVMISSNNSKSAPQLASSLTMSEYDKFNCLLIGCRWLMYGITKEHMVEINTNQTTEINEAKEKDKTNPKRYNKIINILCNNLSKYFSFDSELIDKIQKELIKYSLLLFDNLLNNDKHNDVNFFILRLAIILHLQAHLIIKLSFIPPEKEIASKKQDILDIFGNNESILSNLKEMIIKMGCFMDLHEMIKNKDCQSGNIVVKFSRYYCHFDTLTSSSNGMSNAITASGEHFLLAMHDIVNGNTLMSEINERGDVYLENTISKYIVTSEIINETLNDEYNDYIFDVCGKFRNQVTVVKCCPSLFFFFVFENVLDPFVLCLLIIYYLQDDRQTLIKNFYQCEQFSITDKVWHIDTYTFLWFG